MDLLERAGQLPTGIKQMIIAKIIDNPMIIINYECSNFRLNNFKLNELIWNNLELLKTLWYKYISSELPKLNEKQDVGSAELYELYKNIIAFYKQDVIQVLKNKEEIKKYDVMCKNFENVGLIYNILMQLPIHISSCAITDEKISNVKIVKEILELLEKINYYNFIIDEMTILTHYIFTPFQISILKILLNKGADLNFKEKNLDLIKYGPLIGIIIIPKYIFRDYNINKFDLIKMLLDSGADPNGTDQKGRTTLMVACKKRSYEVVKLLIEYGADVNCPNNKGMTPLMQLCKKSSYKSKNLTKIIKILFKYNSNPHLQNNLNETAFDIAKKNDSQILLTLQNCISKYNSN